MQYGNYRVPWYRGFFGGIAAFLVFYLVISHFLSFYQQPQSPIEIPFNTYAGWVFYNAHHVPLAESVSAWGQGMRAVGYGYIKNRSTPASFKFLYIVPPIFLMFAGSLVASSMGFHRRLSYAIANGASITVGYLLASTVGVFLFSATEAAFGVSGTLQPDLVRSVVVAGLTYPLIFGATGALLYIIASGRVQLNIR